MYSVDLIARPVDQALTDGASISWDVDSGAYASVTLGGNRTLSNPTNMRRGAVYMLVVTQDGTGNRTLAYGNAFLWALGTAPVLSTTAGAVDVITFVCNGSQLYGSCLKGFA